MRYRTFGRIGWRVGEVGYGMWGMSGWTGSDDVQSRRSLEAAAALGVNYYDTSRSYGEGHSELLLGRLFAANPGRRLYAATRIPPLDPRWSGDPRVPVSDLFPRGHIRRCVDMSATNLGLETIPLLLLQGWSESWLASGELQRTVAELRRDAAIRAFGISVSRGGSPGAVRAVESGFVDAVQVVYNVFDQSAADELIPACERNGVAVIARAPLDEGALAGILTPDSAWPAEDWRSRYFTPDNLAETLDRVDAIRPLVPDGWTMAQLALAFALSNPDVTTVIPGMRSTANVEADTAVSDALPLPDWLLYDLRAHRWDREAFVEAW
jgi:aryl-alcohol dehydrogenase-like predicted oxidoreductase